MNSPVHEARDALVKVQHGRIWGGKNAECLDPIVAAIKALDKLAGYDNADYAIDTTRIKGQIKITGAVTRDDLKFGDYT